MKLNWKKEKLIQKYSSMAKAKKQNLKEYLIQIEKITTWFEDRDEIDIEEALEKVKQAAKLIKASKDKLAQVENEFKEIKKTVE
ncbi:MAG: exodeoxyribonuclease VII small subunit [Bacteroidetes bacterium]|nr:exodeoxyribonuclease VII small subunit [Bacteroidota bacterium]